MSPSFAQLGSTHQRFLKSKRTMILLCALLILVLVKGVDDVRFSADYKAYFGENNPELQAFQDFESTYSQGDGILIVAQPPRSVFDESHIKVIHELTEEAWQTPHSSRVDSITNFQHIDANEDLLNVSSFSEFIEEGKELDLDVVREKTLLEPSLVNRLISPDGKTTGIYITLALPGEDHTQHLPESVAFTRDLVGSLREEHPDWKFALTGIALFAVSEVEISQRDLLVLAPIMLLLIGLLLLFSLRSLSAVTLVLIVAALAMVSVLGLSGWIGLSLNPTSAIAIIVVMTLSVADCIHIILTYQDRFNGQALSYDNVLESVMHNAEPVSITSLTTALGFLSLNFSDSPPFHDLGNLAAAGVLIAWFLSMTLLPVCMGKFDVSNRMPVKADLQLMQTLGQFVIRRARTLVAVMGAMTIVFIALIPSLELDDRYVEWFDEDVAFRQETDFATDHLTGPYLLEVSVDSGLAQGITQPQFLHFLEEFESFLSNHPRVLHVNGFTAIQKKLNRAMNQGEAKEYKLPDDRALAAQYLLLYEMSLPFGLDLTNQIDINKRLSRVSITLKPSSQSEIEAVIDDINEWTERHEPDEVSTSVTGTIFMFVRLADRNIRSMLWGTGIAFVLISGLLVLALGSWRLGVLSLIPNVIPIVMTFGLWSLLVGHIGIIASIIAATTLGLVVDDTVHLLTKYVRAKNSLRLNTHEAVMHTFTHVGKALWVTSLVLAAGFLVLSFSSFRLNQEMGVMTALTLVGAIIMDFLLLPAILMLVDRDESCGCEVCHGSQDNLLSIGARL